MSLPLLQAFLFRKAAEKKMMDIKNVDMALGLKFRTDETVCRICGNKGEIPIFKRVGGKMIADDINKCSGIKVRSSDGLPRFMCESCHDLLQKAVKFRKMCLRSVEKLRKLKVEQPEVAAPLKMKVEESMDFMDAEDSEDAPLANVANSAFNLGPETFFFDDAIPNCITCSQDFLDIAKYRNHLPDCNDKLLKGRKGRTAKELKLSRNSKDLLLCEVCGKILNHLGSYLSHKSTHSNVFPFKCDQCDYRGKTKDLLRTHQRSHLAVKPYVCEWCTVTCSTASNLAKHRRTHQPQSPQPCSQCEKVFSSKDMLTRHVNDIHIGRKPVDCDVCGKQFLRRKGLLKHRLKQHNLRTARGGRQPAYLLAREPSPPATHLDR